MIFCFALAILILSFVSRIFGVGLASLSHRGWDGWNVSGGRILSLSLFLLEGFSMLLPLSMVFFSPRNPFSKGLSVWSE